MADSTEPTENTSEQEAPKKRRAARKTTATKTSAKKTAKKASPKAAPAEQAEQPAEKATEKPTKKTTERARKATRKAAEPTPVEQNEQNEPAEKPADKATKKTVKRVRKATRKAVEPAPVEQAEQSAQQQETEPAATAFPDFDRSQLGDRTRVHALAKLLGSTSKELIATLAELGLKKAPQSALTRDEVDRLLAALAGNRQVETPVEDEKIRTRVRKNVENEIHQIVEKIDADLAAAVEEQLDEEPLEDIEPAITPAPETADTSFTPIFRPPSAAEKKEEKEAEDESSSASRRRRRGRRGSSRGRGAEESTEENVSAEVVQEDVDTQSADEDLPEEPTALRGSTRLEAQRRRRTEMREEGRKKRHIVSQAEFLARRESVERTMVVRERQRHDHPGLVTQVGVLEDDLLVEHFVTSEAQASMIGNIYLGRVQNVLPSMEAAFIDIGKGRNGVLYAGEVDWKAAGLGGRGRRIEQALKSGDQVLVQVSKDPVGHKGARLTTQISLAGRYLVYVPGGRSAGISRKLPGPERKRLKEILSKVVPGHGGAIIRTAAEGVSEEAIGADVNRLHSLWEDISERAERETHSKGAKPITMYEEPNMLVKVVRDLFNEDFTSLVVDGDRAWNTIHAYVKSVAPDLLDRVVRFDRAEHDGADAFQRYRIDEQIQKALARKVWLPSGGTLIIERTEAMTVVDVNTGKFTGSGGTLEETVTRNNLEAAEEIVRQMRLRDLGGMIVVDFIDMVLPENQDLVLRRLKEALGRDRTRHQVSEVTSLGLVQMTRKRLGTGLLDTFSTECEHCGGRGLILHDDPVEETHDENEHDHGRGRHDRGEHQERQERRRRKPEHDPARHPAAVAMHEPQSHDESDSDIEELAASVIVTDDENETPEQGTEKDTEKEQSRRRRSRGRSGGRGRRDDRHDRGDDRRDDGDEQDSDLERIVSAAVSRADEADPEEPSGRKYVADDADGAENADDVEIAPTGEKTFQQAVAEFEASPRRRRKTRGNSRSDRRPKAEDFRRPDSVMEDTEVEQVEITDEDRPSASKQRRDRRRTTRSNRAARGGQDRSRSEERDQQPTRAARSAKKTGQSRSSEAGEAPAAPETAETIRARGRRRAVRKVMRTTGASGTAATRSEKPASEQGGVDKRETPQRSGRGRRRATRRGSSR